MVHFRGALPARATIVGSADLVALAIVSLRHDRIVTRPLPHDRAPGGAETPGRGGSS
jgi:hypothetical protein